MSRLSSQQRKLVYLAGIVVLLIPVIMLGMPNTGEEDSGGKLAELRQRYKLGESTLGDVDPTSAAMNLVLLGLRGVAANLLWMEHEDFKQTKNWAQMRATAESIIMLQPHYLKVWRYHGWDLAYNTSAEWDAVADRWYWVKEGAKFTRQGTRRNADYPDLYWEMGRILGQKIGRADEWRFYRQFFKNDPDPDAAGYPPPDEPYEIVIDNSTWELYGPDSELNPEGEDNYLVAKDWYMDANRAEETHDQDIMMRMLFRQYPARSQLDYAEALQREGYFDETTRFAWDRGFENWTTRYPEFDEEGFGQEEFTSPGGTIILEATPEIVKSLAEADNVDEDVKWRWIDSYQKIANYDYWRTRALSEAETNTVEAHRAIHDGKRLYQSSRFYPVTYQAVEGACEGLPESSLSDQKQTVLKALCDAGTALSFQQLMQREPVAAEFPQQNPALLLQALRELDEADLVRRNVSPAQERLETGMKRFETMLQTYEALKQEDRTVEEALLAYLYWRSLHELNNDPLPKEFPLKDVVMNNQNRLQQVMRTFQRENQLR